MPKQKQATFFGLKIWNRKKKTTDRNGTAPKHLDIRTLSPTFSLPDTNLRRRRRRNPTRRCLRRIKSTTLSTSSNKSTITTLFSSQINFSSLTFRCRSKMARSFGFSFQVSVVVMSIIYIYLSSVFVFIDRWFGLWTSNGIMNAVAFTGVAVMCVSNYAAAIFTDPGRVPSTFSPDIEDAENPIHEIKRKVLHNLTTLGFFFLENVNRHIDK